VVVAVDGQSLFLLPALDRPDAPAEVGRDLLPGLEPAFSHPYRIRESGVRVGAKVVNGGIDPRLPEAAVRHETPAGDMRRLACNGCRDAS
jgi:hypothetical protein